MGYSKKVMIEAIEKHSITGKSLVNNHLTGFRTWVKTSTWKGFVKYTLGWLYLRVRHGYVWDDSLPDDQFIQIWSRSKDRFLVYERDVVPDISAPPRMTFTKRAIRWMNSRYDHHDRAFS